MRRYHSLKDELVRKAREAMLAAVQIYNNPHITFKSESFISLAIISWTYLMHAYYRSIHIDYRYYHIKGKRKEYDRTKYGAYKRWELERCMNENSCPLDSDTQANLRFLIGIRHEIEHQMTERIDEFISAKLQACAINFDFYITKLFGEKYKISEEVALVIQFSPLTPEQGASLRDNPHLTTSIKNYVCAFEDELPDHILKSSKYAYRILFVPIAANRAGQADRVVEFVKPDSELAGEIDKILIKETEKPKYLPSQIVQLMREKGFTKFKINIHTDLWKSKNARKNPRYGTTIANTWYWYKAWVDEVEKYCREHRAELQ
ncbi:MAG TPA: DUF3644 domain-containing protein [Ruminococcus sp.]|nr:DUF3644 domain-containing protein [Ruminococcus sp.]